MQEQFVSYDNSGLKGQPQMTMGMDMGLRIPEFDIEVTSEKANPYKKMEINDLALNFYNLGFFNPQMSDQALACLNMMDFNKKEEVMQKISENGTLQEMLLLYQQMALQFASQISPELGDQVAQQILGQGGMAMPQALGDPNAVESVSPEKEEHPFVERARAQARESTQAE
jgi:hypothetical protein